MPVREVKSDVFRSPHDGDQPIDSIFKKARLIVLTSVVTNLADDETASTFRLAEIPSHAILHHDTFFEVSNWGFAQVVIGTRDDTDAMVDQTRATENMISPIAKGDANHGKRLWEVLGLAEDPGGAIALFAHAEANATAAGEMKFGISYLMD